MKYVGDLSTQDAEVLESLGSKSHSILEFGMGASTQVLCQSKAPGSRLVSLETDPMWMNRTRMNLDILGVPAGTYELIPYEGWQEALAGRTFDFIFVDGVEDQRDPFARAAFPLLEVGGWILFHDTRRPRDLRNMVELLMAHHTEVGDVRVRINHSNISGFQKTLPEPYEEWNSVEGRNEWMVGWAEPPKNWPELLDTVTPLKPGANQWVSILAQRQFIKQVKDQFPEFFHGRKILEIGCLGLDIQGEFSNCDYTASETIPGHDKKEDAKTDGGHAVHDNYDVVISCEAMEHDPDWATTLARMIQLTKPGGLLLMGCATLGRRAHGTSGSAHSYYFNLTGHDITKRVDLSALSAYDFVSNWDTYDLYFFGVKRSPESANDPSIQTGFTTIKKFYRQKLWSSAAWIRRSIRNIIKARLFGIRGPAAR